MHSQVASNLGHHTANKNHDSGSAFHEGNHIPWHNK